MKKTLITLAALAMASVAFSAETMTGNEWGNYEVGGGKTYDATTYTGTGNVFLWGNEATFEVAGNATVTFAGLQGYEYTTNNGADRYGAASYTKTGTGTLEIARIHYNGTDDREGPPAQAIVNGGTLKFGGNGSFANNITVNSGAALDLTKVSSLEGKALTLNTGSELVMGGSALAYNGALTLGTGVTIDLSSWNTSSEAFSSTSNVFTGVSSLASTTPVTFDFGNGDIAKYTLSLNEGSVTATKLVPEPTTATLSLLALAGLAARRRRK